MSDLLKDLTVKVINLYRQKKYSKLERALEKFKNLRDLPRSLQMTYAVSKVINPKSRNYDYKKAAIIFEKIYNKDKSNLEPLYNLIIANIKANRFSYLNLYLKNIYDQNKKDVKIIEGLSKTNFFLGNMINATRYYHELILLMPNFIDCWSKFLASFNYHQNITQKEYLNHCKKLDSLPKIKSSIQKLNVKKKIINLGFFSSDFRKHSVSYFLKDIFTEIDQEKFKLFAFSNLSPEQYDDVSFELKKKFNVWEDVSNFSDEEFLNLIVKNDIDILIDLAGFTSGNRINAFRARCAPIQISWLGYCNTLGIENMDYLISDYNLIKENEEYLYSEKILRMPKIWNALSKPKNMPNINIKFLEKGENFTFGSLNNFQKISDKTIEVWSKILNSTNSKLVLKSSVNDNEDLKNNILKKFEDYKVDLKKIIIFDRVESNFDHLNFYNRFHLTLDTFPYPGVTTSFESVLMGRPVLVMKGNNFNSRCGESININLGLNDFNSNDEIEYYEKAINFSKDFNILDSFGDELREKALKSPLFDVKNFSKDFNNLLLNVLNNH